MERGNFHFSSCSWNSKEHRATNAYLRLTFNCIEDNLQHLRNREEPWPRFCRLNCCYIVSRGSDSPWVYRIVRGIRLILRANFVENFMPLPFLSLSLCPFLGVCVCVSLDAETDECISDGCLLLTECNLSMELRITILFFALVTKTFVIKGYSEGCIYIYIGRCCL